MLSGGPRSLQPRQSKALRAAGAVRSNLDSHDHPPLQQGRRRRHDLACGLRWAGETAGPRVPRDRAIAEVARSPHRQLIEVSGWPLPKLRHDLAEENLVK